MVDMSDPEVIQSLKYLLLAKEEKIRIQTLPFDPKKNVFVPDHKEGFLRAEIQSEDEKKAMTTVKTEKGDVKFKKLFKSCL